MNTSRKLAEFAGSLKLADVPESIAENVRIRILDYIASAAAGYKVNRAMNDIVLNVLMQQGGEEQCSLLMSDKRLPAAAAAYYNAFVCNGADMDDGHMLANGHPGVCVIPAVLALGEWRGLAYEDIAAAIIAGYEVFIRLAGAMAPSHLRRGFNGTGTSGTVAAAAACARALGLDTERVHAAIGLAATSASGLMELNESGQAMKPINPAKSACNGMMCALLAEGGAVGPEAPLDGSKGYFRAFADEVDKDSAVRGLGTEFLMDTAYIKLYPACRHMHAMVDCGAELYRRGGVRAGDVKRIRLCTYPASEKLTGLIRFPSGEDEAKFSLTYAAAVALTTGGFTLDDLYKAADMSGEVHGLIEKMDIVVCPELENRAKMLRGARMEIETLGGEILTAEVKVPKGEKSCPLGDGDLFRKLSACAVGVLSDGRQRELYDAAMTLDTKYDIAAFYAAARPEV